MAVNIQDMLIQAYMREFIGGDTPVEREKQKLSLENIQASITPLSNYENNFANKWARTVTGSETAEELSALKISNKNLYESMTKNMSPDKKIPMTDSYTANDLKIDRQVKLVNDYSAYKKKIDFHYGEVETALFHNAKTLDQLGAIHAKGFDNWEDIYSTGTSEQIAEFRKNVQPYLEENGEKISKLLQNLVLAERDLAKFGKRSDIGFVSRDVDLLRNLTSNLGQELKTTTLLTDKESRALQDMWINKDMKPYILLKTEQEKEGKILLDELKARKKILVGREADFSSRLRIMVTSDQPDIEMKTGFSKEDIAKERATLRGEIKKIDVQMLRTGEIGAATGVGGDITLKPISPAAIEAEEKGELGLKLPSKNLTWDINIHGTDSTREERTKNRMQTYKLKKEELGELLDEYNNTGGLNTHGTFDAYLEKNKDVLKKAADVIDDEIVTRALPDVNELIGSYSKAYTKAGIGSGFNRTEAGNKFMSEHGLNADIMARLGSIENAKMADPRGELPQTQKAINDNKKRIISSFEDIEDKRLKTIKSKAVDYIKAYSKGNKVPSDKIAILKKAYPNIDKYIAEWKDYGAGKQFPVWLRDRINKGKADKIDYRKFEGI